MARQTTSGTLNPATGAITIAAVATVDPTQVVAVYDTTLTTVDGSTALGKTPYPKGYPLFFANMAPLATAAGSVLTIPKGLIPPQAKASDTLNVVYGYAVTPTVVQTWGQG